MLKLSCLLLLTILYQVFETEAIYSYDGQVITKSGIINESHFNNTNIIYLVTNSSIILQPLKLNLPGSNRIYFYKITNLYYSYLYWNYVGKSEILRYSGQSIHEQVTFVSSNNTETFYALHFVGNRNETEVEFLFKNDECSTTLKVEDQPTLLFPGRITPIYQIYQYQASTISCTFNIQSNNESYMVNMTSLAYYNYNYQDRLTLDGIANNSTNLPFSMVKKDGNSILEYQMGYYRLGFILHISAGVHDQLITADGSVKVKVNDIWYYLQHSSLRPLDAHVLCQDTGNATYEEMRSRPAGPNESLIFHRFNCSLTLRHLHYCSKINVSEIYFRDYYHKQERVEQVLCAKTLPVRQGSNSTIELKIVNEWYEVCYSGIDQNAALLLCRGLGYKTLRNYGYYYNYNYYNYYYYYNSAKTISSLRCSGKNNLKDCLYSNLNYCYYRLTLNCTNNPGLLKIVPGYHNKGLVQIGEHSICTDSFTKTTADRICMDLGYINAIKFWGGSSYMTPVKMSCSRFHSSVEHCHYTYNSTCSSGQSVYIFCQNIRLTGRNTKEGRVELIYKNQVGQLCDDYFNTGSAHTICKQLGYSKALTYSTGYNVYYSYGSHNGRYLLNNLVCDGRTNDINSCSHSNWTHAPCHGMYEATAVRCLAMDYCKYNNFTTNIGEYNGTNRHYVPNSIANIIPNGASDWCTGVFIDEQWILTSASCFQLSSSMYTIYINPYYSTRNLTVYKYSAYNDQTGDNNLALVKVYHTVDVIPICIHNESEQLSNSIHSAGWNETKFLGWKNYNLYSGMTHLFSSTSCASNTGLSSNRVANLFCAPNVMNPPNGFYGQSGGPIFARYNNKDVLLGITNKAIKAARPFNNMIFTNVNKYKGWIDSIINSN